MLFYEQYVVDTTSSASSPNVIRGRVMRKEERNNNSGRRGFLGLGLFSIFTGHGNPWRDCCQWLCTLVSRQFLPPHTAQKHVSN
jgi:hypothetical protein